MSFAFHLRPKRIWILATIAALAMSTVNAGWNTGDDGSLSRPAAPSREIEVRQAQAIYYAGTAQAVIIRKKIHSPIQREYQKDESLQPTAIRKKIIIQTENGPEEFEQPAKMNDSSGAHDPSIMEMEPEQKEQEQPSGEVKTETEEAQQALTPELNIDAVELPDSVIDEEENQKKIEFEDMDDVSGQDDTSTPQKIIGQDDKETASDENDGSQKESLHPYSIMLSSCRRWASVPELLSRYRKMGLSAYFVKVDLGESGVWWRIFLGSYTTREEAQRIKQIHNLSESIVKKMPYANLIDSFSSEAEATASIRHLEGLQYSPYLIQHDPKTFQLLVGAFITREGAAELKSDLHSKGIPNKVIER